MELISSFFVHDDRTGLTRKLFLRKLISVNYPLNYLKKKSLKYKLSGKNVDM